MLLNDTFAGKLPDILLLCETWMSANSPDVRLPSYSKVECHRMHKKGGGVCIFVNDPLSYQARPDLQKDNINFEHCVVEIKLKKHNLIVGSIYHAPNCNQTEFLAAYKQFVGGLSKIPNSKVILGMDHNLDLLKSHLHNNTQQFINMNYDSDLFPVITKPTRITHASGTLIDNIFFDSLLNGSVTNRIIIVDISDHLPTVTILENINHSAKKKMKITSRDPRLKQLKSLKEDLTTKLNSIKLVGDTNKQFDTVHEIML